MIQSIHIAIFVISIIMTFILLKYEEKYMSTAYVLMVVIINISNLGYMQLKSAQTLEAAILANKIAYMGGCFLPYFIMGCICKVCKRKVPRELKIFALSLNIITYCLVWTIGYSSIYYKEATLAFNGSMTILLRTYGPAHNIFIGLLAIYYISAYIIIIQAFFRKSEVSYKSATLLLGMIIFSTVMYILGSVFQIKEQCIPLIYLVDGMCLLFLLHRIKMYDVSTLISKTIDDTDEYGFIVFDAKKNYLGSNLRAKSLFKELETLKIDSTSWSSVDSPLIRMIYGVMRDADLGKSINFCQVASGDLEIKCTLKYIMNQYTNRMIGYYIHLVDETEQFKYVQLLNNYNEQLEKDVAEKVFHIQQMQNDMILGMADIIESRDSNTGGHVRRTSQVVSIIVQEMMRTGIYKNISIAFFESVVKAAPLHDFGKIAIEDSILRKTGRFTDEEFEKMKQHSSKGAKIVKQILKNVEDTEFFDISVNIAHYHHEKWNGLGYPEQLKGEEIPLEARIMALADVFDALVSKRCYKNQYSYDEAFKIIEESLGTHFDPTIGEIFLACRPKLEALYNRFEESSTVV